MDQVIPTLIYEIQVKYDKLCSPGNLDKNSYIVVFFTIVDIINLLEGKKCILTIIVCFAQNYMNFSKENYLNKLIWKTMTKRYY